MAVPRNRHSNARKGSRRSHHAKRAKSVLDCTSCGKPRLSHRMCLFCSRYDERVVIDREKE